jgi:hypothetical protein
MYRNKSYISGQMHPDTITCQGCNELLVRERASDHWQRDPKQIRYFYRYADTGETHSDYCVTYKPNETLKLEATRYHRLEN